MLPLDDERWLQLDHRGWANGKKYELDPDAPFIPDELAKLLENPNDIDTVDYISPYLCSEGTTWDAAYAAVPYFVEMAKRLSPRVRVNYFIYLGFIVIHAIPTEYVEEFLRDDYEKALKQTMPLLLETLKEKFEATETKYLLATLAALKGFTKLGDVLANLDSNSFCMNCDEVIFDYEEIINQKPS
jgi:hypothetical protein